jgi:hypothetical protein
MGEGFCKITVRPMGDMIHFFVKRQVKLLKPNYLEGKNKQNFEDTQ